MTRKVILLNFFITAAIVFILMWLLPTLFGQSAAGEILAYIVGIVAIPSLLILSLFKGEWGAIHDVSFFSYVIVSAIFYAVVVFVIQAIIIKYKIKKYTKKKA